MLRFVFPVLAMALSSPLTTMRPSTSPYAAGVEIVAAPPICVDLVASQLNSVGQVCATVDGGEMTVRLVAAEGYRLAETHIAVGSSLAGIPLTDSGMPQIGRFPHKTTHAPTVSEASYQVALESLRPEASGEVFVAVHASVIGAGGLEEGAWADGTRFREEGNPATYFTVPVGG